MPSDRRLQTVAETRAFSDDVDAMMSLAERELVIAGIAADPEGGDLIRGAGGLRKRRIPLAGRGKRGGARVITLYLGERFPVYAVFLFAKNEQENLSPAQSKALQRLVTIIKAQVRMKP